MSIQTELTRITNAKAAIKTAIEGKGVTVPSGTLIDGMAALIESIEAGGGDADFSSLVDATACVSGTITPSSDTSNLFIYDDFSKVYTVPRLFILFSEDAPRTAKMSLFVWINTSGNPKADATDGFALIGHQYTSTGFWISASRINGESNSHAHLNHSGNAYYYDSLTIIQSRIMVGLAEKKPSSNYGNFSAGATYKYLVIGS